MIKVGVIFGGETVEHEVSIITAVQAMSYMDKEKYEAIPIYISKESYLFLKSKEIQRGQKTRVVESLICAD